MFFTTTKNIGSLFRRLRGDAALESGCKDGNKNVTKVCLKFHDYVPENKVNLNRYKMETASSVRD